MRTLRNAVQHDQVHHAYLFVGSRGTGKTSMAKILAACLNCEHGPTVSPCGQCESCRAIARASSLDVIEMDAASNNSVDDIRELRDSVAFAPVSGRRKVYILDEAHMLSTAAWNAFLKTLEEPPPNTVFVLATTEAGKVPATVVDRCHRFDFQRPTVEQIAQVLRRTAEQEAIEIPPRRSPRSRARPPGASATRSARSSSCSPTAALRSPWRTCSRCWASPTPNCWSGPSTRSPPGMRAGRCSRSRSARTRGATRARSPPTSRSRARELLVVQTLGEVPSELALTPEADARLAAQAERVPHATVVRLLELIGSALESVRAGADARTSLELALVKAARPEVDASTRALLTRIERLEGGRAPARPVSPATHPVSGAARGRATASVARGRGETIWSRSSPCGPR